MDVLHRPVELLDALLALLGAGAGLAALALLLAARDRELLADVLERVDEARHDVERDDGARVAERPEGRVREGEEPGLKDGDQGRGLGPLVQAAEEHVGQRGVVHERLDERRQRAVERPERLVARDERVRPERLLRVEQGARGAQQRGSAGLSA